MLNAFSGPIFLLFLLGGEGEIAIMVVLVEIKKEKERWGERESNRWRRGKEREQESFSTFKIFTWLNPLNKSEV